MANLTNLLRGLERYEKELERHNRVVSEAFQTLQTSLSKLTAVYEGVGAREFQAHWIRTGTDFKEYISGAQSIQRVLTERIDRLREADRAEGL